MEEGGATSCKCVGNLPSGALVRTMPPILKVTYRASGYPGFVGQRLLRPVEKAACRSALGGGGLAMY
jgi:hypothetical protein